METIVSLFQTVGFPVSCVICLGWYLKNYIEKVETANEQREENYRNIIKTIQEEKKTMLELLASYKDGLQRIGDKVEQVATDVDTIKEKLDC